MVTLKYRNASKEPENSITLERSCLGLFVVLRERERERERFDINCIGDRFSPLLFLTIPLQNTLARMVVQIKIGDTVAADKIFTDALGR